MILYKYRECSEWTDSIFQDQIIWLAKPDKLNDPCECSIHELAPEWVADRIMEMKSAQISGSLMFGASSNYLKEIKRTIPSITNFDGKYMAFRDIYERHFHAQLSNPDSLFMALEDQLKGLGVFSLASAPDNPLMWSHYAKQHEGICLGFELRDLTPSTDPTRFLKVRYSDEIPKIDGNSFIQQISFSVDNNGAIRSESSIPLTDKTVRSAISTKSICWKYEGEWRYIESQGDRAYPFPGPIVEITFGLRCRESDRKRYIELAKKHLYGDVRVYEICRVKNTLQFERRFLEVLSSQRDLAGLPGPTGIPIDDTSVADHHPELERMMSFNQVSKALPLITELLLSEPESAKLWRHKGLALGRMGKHDEALECFERALRLDPEFFSAWYHKGVALMELQRYEESVAPYEMARKLIPTDGSTNFNLAQVKRSLGLTAEAIDLLKIAKRCGHPRADEVLRDLNAD